MDKIILERLDLELKNFDCLIEGMIILESEVDDNLFIKVNDKKH